MTRSEPSNHTVINDRGEEVTWQHEERLIARGFLAVDLHISEEGYVEKLGSPDAF